MKLYLFTLVNISTLEEDFFNFFWSPDNILYLAGENKTECNRVLIKQILIRYSYKKQKCMKHLKAATVLIWDI